MPKPRKWTGYGEALAGVILATIACRLLLSSALFADPVSFSTVALSYLLVVLITASRRGLGASIFASIAGMICFDFFFLPPIYQIDPKDPHDWVALAAFLVTANVASRLWAASRMREEEARRNREQVLKLYRLSCAIIVNLDPGDLSTSIAQMVLEAFGYRHCGVFQKDERGIWHCASIAHSSDAQASFEPAADALETVFRTGNPSPLPTAAPKQTSLWVRKRARSGVPPKEVPVYVPLKSGSRAVAVLALVSDNFQRESIDAIASLVALALERSRFLRELQIRDSLKKSDALKSALLASVSHNLRTPLTSIRASVESILSAEGGQGDPTVRELHLIISEEVDRLSRIVDNLLEMARVEAGELKLRKEWTSVPELLENTLQICAAVVRDRKILVTCSESLPLVKVDRRLLTEVLANLIDNAAKYSPAESEIILGVDVDGQTLRLSVTDHGPGIAPGEAELIFDKFYRGTQLNQQAQKGTGMGLAIARGIVEAHSGRIWVESSPGNGATFVFTVPAECTALEKSALG